MFSATHLLLCTFPLFPVYLTSVLIQGGLCEGSVQVETASKERKMELLQ
jgi:hypothetical protein